MFYFNCDPMEKDFTNMSKDEMNEWMDSLSKPEQLEQGRNLLAELREKYGDDPNEVTPEEYAQLEQTITFLEVAIEFEATTLIEDVKQLPEADILRMMWEWIGDLAGDRERVKRIGIDGEIIKRWSKTIGTMSQAATKRRKELRKQGKIIPTLFRAERPEYDNRPDSLVTEIGDPSKLIPLVPTIGPNNNN